MTNATLPKGYEPADVEARWSKWWEENKTFTPDLEAEGEPYSIVIPPPNVTGALHMGHALNLTLQDILCRYHRQKGRNVLWVPGTDHAGIATQNVVERQLAKEGKGRDDLGREAFIERVWQWREEYGSRILNQIRRMGASVDWTRERFTMDEGLSKAVREVFVRLYEDGLVYKGDYIINWCNRCHTALADDEVDHAPKKGHLYHVRYPLADGSGHLTIATTRPETMLADTGIAVHPDDDRYRHLVGKTAILPLVGRELPIFADKYVDLEFGTGALKVTPAHDHNDWELGRKHNLGLIQVIDEDGNMNEEAGPEWVGMSKEDCRKAIVEKLREEGYLISVEDHDHNVGTCYRCKSVVEPHVSTQWFVSMKPLAEKARAAVPSRTQIHPEHWTKTYYNWLDEIRDWCISRQIWWGHRIPAWNCPDCGELIVAKEDPTACTKCGSANIVQEEDVLDTWFSSALWPFSTMGWPDKTAELDKFYPTSVLTTGFDILFFWVARMMMMGLHFMDEVPFHDVYIHALVRDGEGKKMSKSTGNVIDPIDMIDKYGCDSLRFTLAAFAAMGRDIKLAEDRIEGYRHFVNKIWNAARFAFMKLPEEMPAGSADLLGKAEGIHHKWILHRLEEVKAEMDDALTNYRFNDAAMGMYRFVWNEFCDWYLEMSKADLNSEDPEVLAPAQAVLHTVLREILVLMHPVMPFVTQEIWSALPSHDADDLATVSFPEARPECRNEAVAKRMTLLQEAIVCVRNIRGELNIAPSMRLNVLVRAEGEDAEFLREYTPTMQFLARLGEVTVGPDVEAPKASASSVVNGYEVHVLLEGAIDFDAELARLEKEMGKLDKELNIINKKLANEGFISNAPAAVVAKEKEKAETLSGKRDQLEQLQQRLRSAMG